MHEEHFRRSERSRHDMLDLGFHLAISNKNSEGKSTLKTSVTFYYCCIDIPFSTLQSKVAGSKIDGVLHDKFHIDKPELL
jgi:hypothetical protein